MLSAGLFKAPAIEPDLRGLVMVRLPTGGEVVTPLCSSTHAAACWSSSTFAGQRPWVVSPPLLDPFSPSPRIPVDASDLLMMSGLAPLSILHPSTLIAPGPCVRTFLATVFSARGLGASTIGSNAGVIAV